MYKTSMVIKGETYELPSFISWRGGRLFARYYECIGGKFVKKHMYAQLPKDVDYITAIHNAVVKICNRVAVYYAQGALLTTPPRGGTGVVGLIKENSDSQYLRSTKSYSRYAVRLLIDDKWKYVKFHIKPDGIDELRSFLSARIILELNWVCVSQGINMDNDFLQHYKDYCKVHIPSLEHFFICQDNKCIGGTYFPDQKVLFD